MNSQKVTIRIENLKCHGCANTITNGIKKFAEVTDVVVKVEDSIVEIAFSGSEIEIDKYKQKLAQLGYPEDGKNSGISVVKSYVSCAIGRMNN